MFKSTKTALLSGAIAVASSGAAFADAHSSSACLITKTDTNPFFVKMREGAAAKARRDKWQDRDNDPEANHVQQDHREQQTPVASGVSGLSGRSG